MDESEKEMKEFDNALNGLNAENDDVDIEECKQKMKCEKCDSKLISWYLDKKRNDILFRCHKCKASGIMTKEEYDKRVKNNSELVF